MLFAIKNKKEMLYLAMGVLLCFCLGQYGIMSLFGFAFFPDEFGYWSPAANLLGWDWSQTTSLGSYYSFGYGLLLTPILYLVKDSILAYRTAVFLNVILMCIGLCLMHWLVKKLFPALEGKKAVLISTVAVVCPAWIFYMQSTMTEALLLFGYLLVCVLVWRFFEKPGVLSACFLVTALVYLYTVHMRCIGTIAAGGLTLLIWSLKRRRKKQMGKALLIVLMLLLLFWVALGIKSGVVDRLYGSASSDMLSVNDYSGQWKKIWYVFSREGMIAFFTGLMAKLLYLGASTFGLAYWGLWSAGKRALRLFGRKEKRENTEYFWLFLFLSLAAQILVTVFYTIESTNGENRRLDLFVHGRYDELIVPILTALGLERILGSRKIWSGTGICAGVMCLFTLSSVWTAQRVGISQVQGYFMVGMSYMLSEEHFSPATFLWEAVCFACIVMIAVAAVASILRKYAQREWILLLLVLVQVLLGMQASQHYIYIGESYGYGDVKMADKVLEHLDTDGPGTVIHLYEGGTPYIEQVQFRLRNLKVEIRDGTAEEAMDELRPEDLVIVQHWSGLEEPLNMLYDENWTSGHLSLYYNE